MGKRPEPKPILFADLKLKAASAQTASFTTKAGRIELSVLAPDLIRLRATRSKSFNEGSFAVVEQSRPAVATNIKERKQHVELSTEQFRFRLDKARGTWHITDAKGWLILESKNAIEHSKKTGFTVRLGLEKKESIMGLGECTGPLNKRGLIRDFWNIDVLGHASCMHPALRSLYIAIPFGIGWRQGRAFGIFWDNPGRQSWDLGCTTDDVWKMTATTGDVDLYIFLGPALPQIVSRFSELTGRMPLPPKWSLGYHQSRYGYPSRKRIEEVARTLRRKQIPCDCIHLDIPHMDAYRVFTFGKTFPKPGEMIRQLAIKGFKLTAILDPGVKIDRKFPVYQSGRRFDAFVKDALGKDVVGQVWPGKSVFPDFFQLDVRNWWGDEQAALSRLGILGLWNDMSEPAAFDLPGKTLPCNAKHHTTFGVKTHAEVHNAYGQCMTHATYDGMLAAAPDRRPFVLSRGGYAGIQRYAAISTGDNSSTWENLTETIPMLLNLSLSGVPNCGADVGGFLENASGEILTRWIQLATFTPYFRNHTNNESRDQEPWAFGPEVEGICRRYIQLRYQLLPYLYCLFAEARETGAPIMRPLAWHHPQDAIASSCGDQFLLGENVLVAPIMQPAGVARSVYLPRGTWFNFWNGEAFDGGQHILVQAPLDMLPVFVRAGTILPFGPVQQYVGEVAEPAQVLHIWPGGHGVLEWYEDDGVSNEYLTGQFSRRRIETKPVGEQTEIIIGASEGDFPSPHQAWRIMLHQQDKKPKLTINGRSFTPHHEKEWGLAIIDLPVVKQEIRMRVR
ncbi:MAG: alpha-glucosidase [Verrucomicrobia bacterium]|nr:alpha-glucosidase [Verrucomicrobiota bacterium]